MAVAMSLSPHGQCGSSKRLGRWSKVEPFSFRKRMKPQAGARRVEMHRPRSARNCEMPPARTQSSKASFCRWHSPLGGRSLAGGDISSSALPRSFLCRPTGADLRLPIPASDRRPSLAPSFRRGAEEGGILHHLPVLIHHRGIGRREHIVADYDGALEEATLFEGWGWCRSLPLLSRSLEDDKVIPGDLDEKHRPDAVWTPRSAVTSTVIVSPGAAMTSVAPVCCWARRSTWSCASRGTQSSRNSVRLRVNGFMGDQPCPSV